MRRLLLPVLLLAIVAAMTAACGGNDAAPEVVVTSSATSPASEASATATVAPTVAALTPTPGTATATVAASATPSATGTAVPGSDPLASMTLEQKVGQLILTGVPGLSVGPEARRLIGDLHIGNVVLMGDNDGTPAQVHALTAALQQLAVERNGVGALIATDQEGGLVQRLRTGFVRLPEAAVVGDAGDADLARSYGAMLGSELRAVGVNMPLGPVLDVNDNPDNPVIGCRAFGTTPGVVIKVGLPFLEGLRGAQVAAVGKHFPGHGNTETDSHFTLPVVKKSRADLEATELAPFRAAVSAGIDAIMIAHVSYPALDPSGLPASLSRPIVTGILRGELGFDGVAITDDMGMAGVVDLMPSEQAAVQSMKAGVDLVICVSAPCDATKAHAALMAAVRSGDLPLARLDEAVRRILRLKQQLHVERMDVGDLGAVGSPAHQAVADAVVQAAGG